MTELPTIAKQIAESGEPTTAELIDRIERVRRQGGRTINVTVGEQSYWLPLSRAEALVAELVMI